MALTWRAYFLAFLAFLGGCHGPASRSWMLSRSGANAEALAGMRAVPAIEARYGGVLRDTDAERRMSHVARRLSRVATRPCGDQQFRLLDSDRIDAVSLPGGYIYVTRALYSRLSRDDLLAAVLAHEMAHLAAKDHFKRRPIAPNGVLDKELAADLHAARLLEAAGVDRTALIELVLLIADTQPEGWVDARVANLSPSTRLADNLAVRARRR